MHDYFRGREGEECFKGRVHNESVTGILMFAVKPLLAMPWNEASFQL
jgi:hypothetical protein